MAGPAQKAWLEIEDSPGKLDCLFNPKDFSVTKANSWEAKAAPGKSAAKPTFGGGQPREMTLQLLFDATLLTPPVSVKDVSIRLFDAMKATKNEGGAKNKSRPPTMTFRWGAFSFEGVAKSLTVQFQLFRPDGDSLASISHRVYGDPTQWRAIAEANGIDDPLRLHSGRALSIPSLDG